MFRPGVAVIGSGLTLPGVPEAKTVSVAAFMPTYDPARKQWFGDIEFSDRLQDSYFPFVRLAVARYQPASVDKKVKLSAVTVCDYVQLAPDRRVTVSALEPEPKSNRPRRKVEVEGLFAGLLEGGP